MRGAIPWEEDPEVNDNIVVCSFLPQTAATMATLRPCTSGYRLHCSDYRLQLYNKFIRDTFIFINRSPSTLSSEVTTSIALQKISGTVQQVCFLLHTNRHLLTYVTLPWITMQQLGRVNKTPVLAIEIHVVSNRDRVAHQLFDLWFEQWVHRLYIGINRVKFVSQTVSQPKSMFDDSNASPSRIVSTLSMALTGIPRKLAAYGMCSIATSLAFDSHQSN